MIEPHTPIGYHSTYVLFNHPVDGGYHLALHAPAIAQQAQPGHFLHLLCDPHLTLRRPFSILNAYPEKNQVDILYKVVGEGTQYMTLWQTGDVVDCMGPLGQPFQLKPKEKNILLLAGGVGIAPLYFLAQRLNQQAYNVTLLFGSEQGSFFNLGQPKKIFSFYPEGLCLLNLEQQGIPSLLATLNAKPGWWPGYVTNLAQHWLGSQTNDQKSTLYCYLCGPTPMLKVAGEWLCSLNIPGQVSLEERMACGFGGCAGCVVPVTQGYAKACIEGPVFSLHEVDWQRLGDK